MADKKFEVLDGMLVSGNANFDSGVLFVDSVNNRVGVNKTNPADAVDVIGNVQVSGQFTGSGAGLTSIPQSAVTNLTTDYLRSNASDDLDASTLTLINSSIIKVSSGKIVVDEAQGLHVGQNSTNVHITVDATGDSMNVTSGAANIIFKKSTGTNVLYLDTSAVSASVNSAPSAGFALYVSGNSRTVGEFSATGDIVAYASDGRLKKILHRIEDPLEKISKINGYYFEWDKDACEEAGFVPAADAEHGLIAQEVEEIMPEFVVPAPFNDDYKTLKYDRMVSLLVECIKELKEEISDLKNKIK